MEYKSSSLLWILTMIILSYSSSAQDVETAIDSLVQTAFEGYNSGLSIIATQHGNTVYHKGFGQADIELSVPMDKDYIFRLGSITKQFTASAILQLEEKGKLSVQDPLSKYFPEYGTEGKEVTIEHLLTHTSGIPSYTNAPEWDDEAQKRHFEPMDLILEYATDTLEFDPGTEWNYNNTGYFMLGMIVEKVSGQTYEGVYRKEYL